MISLKCKDQHLLPALQLCSIVFPVCSFYAIDITKTAVFPVCSFYSIDITKTTGPVLFFLFLKQYSYYVWILNLWRDKQGKEPEVVEA